MTVDNYNEKQPELIGNQSMERINVDKQTQKDPERKPLTKNSFRTYLIHRKKI